MFTDDQLERIARMANDKVAKAWGIIDAYDQNQFLTLRQTAQLEQAHRDKLEYGLIRDEAERLADRRITY